MPQLAVFVGVVALLYLGVLLVVAVLAFWVAGPIPPAKVKRTK